MHLTTSIKHRKKVCAYEKICAYKKGSLNNPSLWYAYYVYICTVKELKAGTHVHTVGVSSLPEPLCPPLPTHSQIQYD